MNFDFTIFENGWNYIQSPIRWFEALDPVVRNTVVSGLALFVSILALCLAYGGFRLALAKDTREELATKLGTSTKEGGLEFGYFPRETHCIGNASCPGNAQNGCP
jgi:hypothetical protein